MRKLAQLLHKLEAVHLRHQHIGDHQPIGAPLGGGPVQHDQSLGGATGRVRKQRPALQQIGEHAPVGGVVIHGQDAQTVRQHGLDRARRFKGGGFKVDREAKARALARLAFHPDAPAHRFGETLRDGEAQAGSSILPSGGAVSL